MLNPDYRDMLSAFTEEGVKYPAGWRVCALQIGIAPRRVDILTTIDAVEFKEAWPERKEVEVEGLKIPVISRHHLLQNKRATGRPRDQADAIWLIEEE